MPSLRTLVPSLGWLRSYSKDWLRADVTAGLTAAAVVIPKAMAYAAIAGLPLQVGLYTAFVPMVIYAFLGTSRPLSVSTTTTIAILAGAELRELAPGAGPTELIAAGAALALLVGMMLVVAAVLRFGFVANFISEPVLIGFKGAIAFVITVDQLPKLLGVHISKAGFFRDAWSVIQHVPQTSTSTLVLALALFALMFLLERFLPKAPAPLIAIAAGIAASSVLGLAQAGVETVGAVPRGLPAFVPPVWGLFGRLWPAAAGIALMSFTESVAAARAFRGQGEPALVPNQELLATGLANVGGGLFGAMPGGGGTSQTAVNSRAGANTQVSALVTAAMSLATLLLLAPVIALLPQAALAAVVVAYSIELFKPAEFREIRRTRRTEFRWAVVALLGVLLLGTLKGIMVAVIVSLLALAYDAYNPPVYAVGRKRGTNIFRPLSGEHPDDETWPGLLIVRTEGRVFFANAQGIGDKIWPLIDKARPTVLIIDGRGIIDIEYTALKMLTEGEERLRTQGVALWLVGLNPEVLAIVQQSRLGSLLGRERLIANLETAVDRFLKTSRG
jgi:high affinity sulfate transporter 1